MRTIPIELSVRGCERALKQLRQYEREIKPKLDEVCRRLAEIACKQAQDIFNDPDIAREGNGGVSVTVQKIDNGYAIVAEGHSVYFIEFGTGDAATSTHGYTVSVPVYPGSFSVNNAQKYATYGFWWYAKEKYTETPTYAPMYYAGKAIRENAGKIAQEVFGK